MSKATLEKPGATWENGDVPAHCRRGTGGFLRFLPTQSTLECYGNPLGGVNKWITSPTGGVSLCASNAQGGILDSNSQGVEVPRYPQNFILIFFLEISPLVRIFKLSKKELQECEREERTELDQWRSCPHPSEPGQSQILINVISLIAFHCCPLQNV